ncbi:MAG: GspH/FimT family pseudopilin [Gammaproteobacteria bacterium]
MPDQSRRIRGVTVLELLVTLGIAALLTGYAVPAFTRLVASNRQVATVNQLLGAVQMARTLAIARHQEFVLCPDNGQNRCATGTDEWTDGYLIFVNEPAGRPYQVDSDSDLVAARALPEGVTVWANRSAYVFRPLAVRSSNGTFRVCDPTGRIAPRAVVVSVTGRPRISSKLPDGTPIPCPSSNLP